ncbi:carboxypeptidase regulatory-like domain-containing protein [Rhodocytophaga rosea]|uniref:Carboxypeptidase regulatory-like domain-containing protein n=1 Tax=Rhodocytophaga rosea TaxID=2704465 RepID=A0A6C0GUB7_9BACT|nr:carboxypeptidase-like regulatory domain-containing protein [Rhodocytophaga rosea]QHT71795.1 carboxypeptidase regulatory-like domain-containing protein [Rhodocytophaga rosea]
MILRSNKNLIPFLYVFIALFFSCKADDNDANQHPKPIENEEGYATGIITDTNGNPISGANVRIDNTMFYNSNTLAITDNAGKYKAKLATVGTYNVTAVLVKELNGKSYTIDLHPEKYEVMSNAGGVRNFQLKLTGEKADGLGYYGATVGINSAVGSYIYDSENIEFTLVPVGKLIDGSTGKTLIVKEGAAYTQDYGYLVDIPLGRYQIKAMYSTENGKVPLKIRKKFDEASVYSTTFTLDFDPETSFGKNIAIIEYDYSK